LNWFLRCILFLLVIRFESQRKHKNIYIGLYNLRDIFKLKQKSYLILYWFKRKKFFFVVFMRISLVEVRILIFVRNIKIKSKISDSNYTTRKKIKSNLKKFFLLIVKFWILFSNIKKVKERERWFLMEECYSNFEFSNYTTWNQQH